MSNSQQQTVAELQQLYSEKALGLQREFQTKIQEAQATNDPAAIQASSSWFQTESLKLVEWFKDQMAHAQQSGVQSLSEAAPVTDEDMDIYSHEECSANLNRLAYRGDRNQMLRFLKDSDFMRVVKEVVAVNPIGNVQKSLLSRSMRLSPVVAPDLFKVVERCQTALGLKIQPEIFAVQNQHFNAGCYPISNGRLPISLTSGLLEKFTSDELAFVLGHEFAHALYDHFRIPVDLVAECAPGHISRAQFLRLRAWERSAELSSDRIGLLCSRNFDAAAAAFFKLSSGIVSDRFHFRVDEYMHQFNDLEKYLKEAPSKDVEDLYSTHPFNPIRLKALELFYRSELYREMTGEGPSDITNQEMEQEIRNFCRLVEPAYLDESTEISKVIREFIFYSGFLIARADGDVSQTEIDQLASFLDAATVAHGFGDLAKLGEDELAAMVQARAEVLNRELPVVGRLNVVRDLATIVTADGEVADDEMRILGGICETLGLDPMFTLTLVPTDMAA